MMAENPEVPSEQAAEHETAEQPQSAAAGGSKEYKVAEDSPVKVVEVDGETVSVTESASLTQDQYDRASATGAKLVEAGKE